MNDALSEERKAMVCAISSGFPTRLSGTVEANPAFSFGSSGESIQHLRLDRAWGDGIHADARPRRFQCR